MRPRGLDEERKEEPTVLAHEGSTANPACCMWDGGRRRDEEKQHTRRISLIHLAPCLVLTDDHPTPITLTETARESILYSDNLPVISHPSHGYIDKVGRVVFTALGCLDAPKRNASQHGRAIAAFVSHHPVLRHHKVALQSRRKQTFHHIGGESSLAPIPTIQEVPQSSELPASF